MGLYVILDPNFEYAVSMVQFLNEYDYKAIAVYTDENKYHLFEALYAAELDDCLADQYLLTEYPDMEALAEQIRRDFEGETVDGIIPWDENSVEEGAVLGELLELDWNPVEVIHRFRNKYALKEYLRENTDIRINASAIVSSEEDVEDFVDALDSWPIVVKPSEGSGSRGVFFAHTMEELLEHCIDVFETQQGEVLLEEFIDGPEFVVNGLTNADGDILITDMWQYDKRHSHGIDNLYFQTIKVDRVDPVFEPLSYYAASIIEAMGLRKSPFHMELKVDGEGPCLVECGARFAGGNQPLLASLLHEHSLFQLAATHYIADFPFSYEDVHFELYDRYSARIIKGVQSVEIEQIEAIHGLEEVEELESFYMIGFIRSVGSYLPITIDLSSASYEIYLFHEDPEQIELDAEAVREILWFEG